MQAMDTYVWAIVFNGDGEFDTTIDSELYAGVEYSVAVIGISEDDEMYS